VTERRQILADFRAEWCPPCKVVEKPLTELAAELHGHVVIAQGERRRGPGRHPPRSGDVHADAAAVPPGVVVSSTAGARPKSHLRRLPSAPAEAYVNR
jgi:thioredoxin 1